MSHGDVAVVSSEDVVSVNRVFRRLLLWRKYLIGLCAQSIRVLDVRTCLERHRLRVKASKVQVFRHILMAVESSCEPCATVWVWDLRSLATTRPLRLCGHSKWITSVTGFVANQCIAVASTSADHSLCAWMLPASWSDVPADAPDAPEPLGLPREGRGPLKHRRLRLGRSSRSPSHRRHRRSASSTAGHTKHSWSTEPQVSLREKDVLVAPNGRVRTATASTPTSPAFNVSNPRHSSPGPTRHSIASSSPRKGTEEPLEPLYTWEGHSDIVTCATAAWPLFFTGSCDKTICEWTAGGPLLQTKPTSVLKGHEGWIVQMCHNEDMLFSASHDKTVRQWSMSDHTCTRVLQVGYHLSSVRWECGSLWFTCDEPNVTVCTFERNGRFKRSMKLEGHRDGIITDLVTLEGGDVALTSCKDTWLGVWNSRAGKLTHHLRGHEDHVTAVVCDADSGYAYSSSEDGTLRRWSLSVWKYNVEPASRQLASRDKRTRRLREFLDTHEPRTMINSRSTSMSRVGLLMEAQRHADVYLSYDVVEAVVYALLSSSELHRPDMWTADRLMEQRPKLLHAWASMCLHDVPLLLSRAPQVSVLASAFLAYLSELSEPLIPFAHHDQWLGAAREAAASRVEQHQKDTLEVVSSVPSLEDGDSSPEVRHRPAAHDDAASSAVWRRLAEQLGDLLCQLSPVRAGSLYQVAVLLSKIHSLQHNVNKLAILFGPTLLRSNTSQVALFSREHGLRVDVVKCLVLWKHIVFEGVPLPGAQDERSVRGVSKQRRPTSPPAVQATATATPPSPNTSASMLPMPQLAMSEVAVSAAMGDDDGPETQRGRNSKKGTRRSRRSRRKGDDGSASPRLSSTAEEDRRRLGEAILSLATGGGRRATIASAYGLPYTRSKESSAESLLSDQPIKANMQRVLLDLGPDSVHSSWPSVASLFLSRSDIPFSCRQDLDPLHPDMALFPSETSKSVPSGRYPILFDNCGVPVSWGLLPILNTCMLMYGRSHSVLHWPRSRERSALAQSIAEDFVHGYSLLSDELDSLIRDKSPSTSDSDLPPLPRALGSPMPAVGASDDTAPRSRPLSTPSLSTAAQTQFYNIYTTWCRCRTRYGVDGDFLFGELCAVDLVTIPWILRFRRLRLPLSPLAEEYAQSVLALPGVGGLVKKYRRAIPRIFSSSISNSADQLPTLASALRTRLRSNSASMLRTASSTVERVHSSPDHCLSRSRLSPTPEDRQLPSLPPFDPMGELSSPSVAKRMAELEAENQSLHQVRKRALDWLSQMRDAFATATASASVHEAELLQMRAFVAQHGLDWDAHKARLHAQAELAAQEGQAQQPRQEEALAQGGNVDYDDDDDDEGSPPSTDSYESPAVTIL